MSQLEQQQWGKLELGLGKPKHYKALYDKRYIHHDLIVFQNRESPRKEPTDVLQSVTALREHRQ